MANFGWSYPPGVECVPGDEETICEVCWQSDDTCVCFECPICDIWGDPKCYMGRKTWWDSWQRKYDKRTWWRKFFGHGLIRLPRQINAMREAKQRLEAELAAEAEWCEQERLERIRESKKRGVEI